MQSFQPCSVWRSISWSSSGLPNMPRVEMVMSRLPMASSERLPSSFRSWPLVVCQKNGSKLSNPRSAMALILSAALPSVALIMVPIRMDLAGLLTDAFFLGCNEDALTGTGAFDGGKHHRQALDVVRPCRLGAAPRLDRVQKLGDYAGVAVRLRGIAGRQHGDRLERAKKALAARNDVGLELDLPIPQQRALGSHDPPQSVPAGIGAFRAPRAAVVEQHIVGKFED